jgi:hypothetical protein
VTTITARLQALEKLNPPPPIPASETELTIPELLAAFERVFDLQPGDLTTIPALAVQSGDSIAETLAGYLGFENAHELMEALDPTLADTHRETGFTQKEF